MILTPEQIFVPHLKVRELLAKFNKLIYIFYMSVEKTYFYTVSLILRNNFDNEFNALQNKEPIEPYAIEIVDIKFNKAKIKKDKTDARNNAEVISS